MNAGPTRFTQPSKKTNLKQKLNIYIYMGKNAVINEYFTRYSFHHAVDSAMRAADKHTNSRTINSS